SAQLLATNLTGHPAVILPNGFREDGTPVWITFLGTLFGEASMLAVARAYQHASDFHLPRPPTLSPAPGRANGSPARTADAGRHRLPSPAPARVLARTGACERLLSANRGRRAPLESRAVPSSVPAAPAAGSGSGECRMDRRR